MVFEFYNKITLFFMLTAIGCQYLELAGSACAPDGMDILLLGAQGTYGAASRTFLSDLSWGEALHDSWQGDDEFRNGKERGVEVRLRLKGAGYPCT